MFTVAYALPSPPVTQLFTIYYHPGESVSDIASLGNSPIGIGGTVNTSTVNELINTGQGPGTAIINVQPSDAPAQTWAADNSGNLTIKSDNAGTLSTLLQLIAGASPSVKLAAAAILTEVLGQLQVDGQLTVNNAGTGIIGSTSMKLGQSASGDILDASGTITYLKGASAVYTQVPNGNTQMFVDTTGLTVNSSVKVGAALTALTTLSNASIRSTGHMQLSTSTTDGDVFDAIPAGSTYIKGNTGINFQVPNGTDIGNFSNIGVFTAVGFKLSGTDGHNYQLYAGSLSRLSTFSGTGSTTVNHNLGNTPTYVTVVCNASGGSQTQGVTFTSTQATIVSGAGLSWVGLAVRF